MSDSLKAKIFTTNWDAWNNKWVPLVATPVLIALGVIIGSVGSDHFVSSGLGQVLVRGFFIGATMMTGYALLALIDYHGSWIRVKK